MNTLRFVTWNVLGIDWNEKRLKILEYLNNLHAHIVILHETHIPKVGNHKLISSQFPPLYLASYNSKQRGTAILINKKITLNSLVVYGSNDTAIDSGRKFIIISISTHNTEECIANICCPNVDDP